MKATDKTDGQEFLQKAGDWLELVRKQANSLTFGVIQIVVHDSRVVQIERTEKLRLDRKPLDKQPPTRLLEANEHAAATDLTTGGTEL